MMRHFTCEPGTEVTGTGVLAYTDNIHAQDMLTVVEEVGLTNIDPDGWYPLESVMNLFNELYKLGNMTANLVAVGMSIVKNATPPPGIEDASLVDAYLLWNDFLQINHRNGDVGSIDAEEVEPDHVVVTLRDVYPDDLSYGIAYQYAANMCPPDKSFIVRYEEDVPRMDYGDADETRIHILLNPRNS